jgi:hypothetical protein
MNTEHPSRRKGNVARLPKALRDKINSMLDDGATYPQIIAELEKSTSPRLPYPISVNNLSNWFDGGYQDYLHDQAWRERMTINSDRFLELAVNDDDATNMTAGGLHAAVIQLCQLMDQLFNPKTGEVDPDKYLRATNTLSRLSRSIIGMQKHRRAVAKEKASEPGSKEAQLKARQELLDKMDQLFGIRPVKAINRIFGPVPGTEPDETSDNRTASSSSSSSSSSPSSSPLSSSGGESRREEAVSASPLDFPPLRFGVADTRPALRPSVTVSESPCESVSEAGRVAPRAPQNDENSTTSTTSSPLSSSGGESRREEATHAQSEIEPNSTAQSAPSSPKPKRELPNNWPELSDEYLKKYLNWEVD